VAKDYTHRNLIVWQRAQELALNVMQLTHRLPQSWANAVPARQIVAAVTSVGANIAEGHGRYTPGAHRHHRLIARGSLAETDSWLDLMRRAGWITVNEEEPLQAECREITAMLTSKIQTLNRLKDEGGSSHMYEQHEPYVIAEPDDEPPLPFTRDDYTPE
jgi:four helix bundle protein